MILEAKATNGEWKRGQEEGQFRKRAVDVGDVLKEEVVGGLKGISEGGRPGVDG
jgi:hypothetical protein